MCDRSGYSALDTDTIVIECGILLAKVLSVKHLKVCWTKRIRDPRINTVTLSLLFKSTVVSNLISRVALLVVPIVTSM